MQTAVIYCRVSDQRQADEGNSLVTQEKQAREYAQRAGYILDQVFIERGESAKTDERRVLKEMLAYCQKNKGKIQVVIIPKIDRLARNRDDYGALKGFLSRLQIRLDSVGEHIEDTPVGRFTESILASVAQFDNEIRAERCRGGMVEAVKEGRWVWLAPKGFKNVRVDKKGNIAPKEGECDLIAEAFKRIAAGYQTTVEVRRWLAKQGLSLSASRLHEMLRNKAYIGWIESFGLLVRATPPFVPLITEETFYLAQEAVRRIESGMPHKILNADFPLRGVLVCECCKVMSGCWSQGRSNRYAYYRCTACTNANHPTDTLERQFRDLLDSYRIRKKYGKRMYERLKGTWQERGSHILQSAAELDKQIEAEKELRKAIALKCATGVIPDDLAREQIAELEVKIARLTNARAECPEQGIDLKDVIEYAVNFFQDLGTRWEGLTHTAKRKMQTFLYPNGLKYMKDGTLRTADYPVLELIRTSNVTPYSLWWTTPDLDANQVLEFLEGLRDLDASLKCDSQEAK